MSLLLRRLTAGGGTLTIVVPVATGTVAAPAPGLAVGAVVPLGAVSSSAPAPTPSAIVVNPAASGDAVATAGTFTIAGVVATATATTLAAAAQPETSFSTPAATSTTAAPAPTLVTDMTLTIPTATVTATAPAPTLTTGEPPAAVGGGSTTGLPYGWQLVGREQPRAEQQELEPESQHVRFTIPAAVVYARAYAPTLTIDETDLMADIQRHLAEADELAAIAYLSPV